MTRYLDTLAHPWSLQDVKTAIFKDFSEARASIEETVGAKLWSALADLADTLWIFDSTTSALLDEICTFGDRSKNPAFWHRTNVANADLHTRLVKKSIFQCTSALMALVDHARKFEKTYPITGYKENLQKVFSRPGLHDFLQCLRNYNTHWRVAETNWHIKQSFDPPSRQARFLISKSELLRWDGWKPLAKTYIEEGGDEFDVYELFSNYRRYTQEFYSWHKGAVLDQYAKDVCIYLTYKRFYDGCMQTHNWNLLLSNLPRDTNPYQYLERFLTAKQLERLLTFEHRSRQQVEMLIEMLGMTEFCDEVLKEKALALFREK